MGWGLVGQTPQHSAPAPDCLPAESPRQAWVQRTSRMPPPRHRLSRRWGAGLLPEVGGMTAPGRGLPGQPEAGRGIRSSETQRCVSPPGPLRPLFTLSAPMSCGSGHRQRAGQRGLGPPDPEFRGWWSCLGTPLTGGLAHSGTWPSRRRAALGSPGLTHSVSFVCGDMWLPVFVGFMHFLVLCLPESVTCLFMSFAHFFSPVRGCRQLIPVPQIHHQSPEPRCPRVRLFAEARPLKR